MELSASDECPTRPQRGSFWDLTGTLFKLWSNFLEYPFDIVVPILLSILSLRSLWLSLQVPFCLPELLAARLLYQIPLAASLRTSPVPLNEHWPTSINATMQPWVPMAVSLQSEHEVQTTIHKQMSLARIPLFNGSNTAIAFDTSYIQSNRLEINSQERDMFRRWAVCAPMITNPPRPVWEGTNATHPDGMNSVTDYRLSFQ